MTDRALQRYRKRAIQGPWQLEGSSGSDLQGAVVIPACAERSSLPATLASLACNRDDLLQRWLIVVVINQPPHATEAVRADNSATLDWLRSGQIALPHLAWVDACDTARQLPARDAGVGLARKLGFDLALHRLQSDGAVFASLDADTLVEPTYLEALCAHFTNSPAGGAVLPFAHQPTDEPELQRAIEHYELYLRHDVYGLQLAGSPYAYHSIGSALACRVSAYLAAGGMNRRKAGEDFYFLQQLAKTAGVETLSGTTVHPSPRPSCRVPFGTGEKVARILAGEEAVSFRAPASYASLKQLLALVDVNLSASASEVLQRLDATEPRVAAFFKEERFADIWTRLRQQNRSDEAMSRAFHGWFDALKTRRLVRYLEQDRHAVPAEQATAALLHWSGQEPAADRSALLMQLRRLQGVAAAEATFAAECAMLSPDRRRGPQP